MMKMLLQTGTTRLRQKTSVRTAFRGIWTIPGLNAVRTSKDGYKEGYQFGIVLSSDTKWEPSVPLSGGVGNKDIDFSQFGTTNAWADASDWETAELQKADDKDISDWAKDSVYFMAANGIVSGTGNNMFSPKAVTSEQQAQGYA